MIQNYIDTDSAEISFSTVASLGIRFDGPLSYSFIHTENCIFIGQQIAHDVGPNYVI